MTWLTEDQLAKSAAGEGCGMACDCDAHLYSMARWALRAREWMVRTQVLHSSACGAEIRARNAACTCGLRELMVEAK